MSDHNYPELLQDLKRIATDCMKQQGIESEQAVAIGHLITETIRKNWGGMLAYIPKGKEYELNQRDLKIWDGFKGNNHHELCQRYDISLQRLYKIISIQRQADLRKRQNDLFE